MQSDQGAAVGARSQQPGPSTRQLLIEVAQREISERGYNGVSLRSIARRADVDPSLVRHYFGSKQNLLAHAVQLEIDPGQLADEVLRGSPAAVGRRTVKALLNYWDNPRSAPMTLARLSASLNSDEVARLTRDEFIEGFFGTVARKVSPDHPELRAVLVASQLIAMAMGRYLIADPVLASCSVPELVRVYGQTVQRYLTGPLPVDATGRDAAAAGGLGPGVVRTPHRTRRPSPSSASAPAAPRSRS